MKIRTRLTLWYAGMLLGSLLLMGGVLHYELVGEYERGRPPESPSVKIADILFFYGLPTVVVLVLGGSWLMHRAMRPVEALTARAERVHAGNLSERIPRTGKGDELDRLAEVFNAMLARIEAGTASVRDFALHASHELKTPLTILSAEAELALNDPGTAGAERLRLTSQMEELRRLGRLVDALGLVAKADAGVPVVARERLDFGQLVRQATEDAQVLGNPSGIAVELVRCDGALLDGDPAALRQVLLNILDNAVKHNAAGGWVHVELRTNREEADLTVENSGAALPADLVPRLFERFVRGGGPAAGSGLGLSIAKIIVEAHGGVIDYSVPVTGTVRFAVRLPLQDGQL
ncbi:MAG TPA: ATP-binding protein [Candidatus Didemnitutus sp.]|nr:ATP-binding protein [Candidatus Didemnitutus sp.]